jgi:3D (Asp-Asp-Asp) domain-containing protein
MKPLPRKEILAGVATLAALIGLALFCTGGIKLPSPSPSDTEAALAEPAPPAAREAAVADEEGHVLGLEFIPVTITAYSSTIDQTDKTPWITASLTRARPGVLALSRDLIGTFTPGAPFEYGDLVLVSGVGLFRVEDTMNARWKSRADIWFPTKYMARHWGRRQGLLAKVENQSSSPLLVAEEAHLDAILQTQ